MIPVFTDKRTWYSFCKELMGWLGTPYAHWQMIKGKGADCGLFIAACLQSIGIVDKIDFDYQPRFWHKFMTREIIIDIIEKQSGDDYKFIESDKDKLIRGDILTFNLRSELTNHISVYIGNLLMVHSINNRGVCIVPLDTVYKNRLTKAYRIYK